MTKTNQAFIKAYRKDEAQASPSTPALAKPARVAAPSLATTNAPATAAPPERSALYGPPPILAPRSESPSPPASTGKRPLSSFIASAGIARLDTEPADGDFFRPGTTVASFHWPAVCRTLSRQCAPELGQVGDLLLSHATAGRSLVGIVGLQRSAGATTVALCLGQRLAQRRRTILVDANFRHPGLAALLEAEPTAGWQDVLVRGSPLSDAAIRATEDRLDLLALHGRMPADLARAVAGLQAVVTAGVLRHAYEHVLFDLGAYLDAASQPVVLELIRNMGVDAVVAVSRPKGAATHDVCALADQLARSGCEFLGTIENCCATGRALRVERREPGIDSLARP
jgi:Mrp family chromosome partitioning ATPase